MKILVSLVLSFFFLSSLYAQNLESIGLKKGVKFDGSFTVNSIGYYVHGTEQRRDPFNWFLSGNLNINLFGYNAPLSFSYSNANKSYSQPFNQFSFAPQYKWVKTYIGYNSMTFSNYTLAGHVFLGAGVELAPGKWKLAAMYGRLRKAVPFDMSDTLTNDNIAFKRLGLGMKLGYESNGNLISANLFTAKDDIHSIPFSPPESQLSPQDNVCAGVSFKKTIFGRFFIEGEYAVSALNKDIRSKIEKADTVVKSTFNVIKGLLPENATSRYFDALNASIGYDANWYTIRLRFEQIAPEYETLGAYYFNNDLRNLTIAPSVRLLNNALTLAINAGVQQNNLDKGRASTTKRMIGSVNANYLPNEYWNFVLNYSNFSTYTNIRPSQDPFFQNSLDSLNFYQVSQTTNLSVMRSLGVKNSPQSIMVNLSYQKANDHADYSGGIESYFITTNIAYSYSAVPSNMSLAIAGNLYTANAGGIQNSYWGPTLSITKTLMEKSLRMSLASSYNQTSGSSTEESPVLTNRVNVSYVPKGAKAGAASPHAVTVGISVLNRLRSTQQQSRFIEVTGMFNYTYTF